MTLLRSACAVLVLSSLLPAGLAAADEEPARSKARRPNVLLIFTDDQGYAEAGCYGLTDVPTPHIDSLAELGVRFTDGYVSAPVCSPSRAGLLTGRYQQRFGHEHNPGNSREAGLPLTERTMADYFRAAGYATGLVGKWHLGMTEALHPMSRGFGEFFGFLHGGHDYLVPDRPRRMKDPILRGREPAGEKAYLTDAFGREAVEFIRRHHARPWFLYLSFNAVHAPLQAKPPDLQRFEHIEDTKRRTYAGMLHAMDRSIGLVLDELKKNGTARDTLIFFISDNGGPTKQTTSSNAPLRGHKGQVWEGGIRVPFLLRWDGRVPAGKVVKHPVSALDVLPTALAAAGIVPEKPPAFDGVDLLPYLAGERKAAPHEALFWRMGRQSAVRAGNYKLVDIRGAKGLYDLSADVGESKDLSASQPGVVERLETMYADWEKGTVPAKWRRKGFGGRRGR